MVFNAVVCLVFNAIGQNQTNWNAPTPNTYEGQNFGTSDTYTTTADNTSTAITISNAAVTPVTGNTYDIYVKYTNPQGQCIECTETLHYTFVAIQNPNYYGYYSVAPSPASSDLTIYVDDEKLKNQKISKSPDQVIQRVMIMNRFGTVVNQQTYPSGTRKVSLNVSSLPSDIYVAKIFNGKNWTSIKFIKK